MRPSLTGSCTTSNSSTCEQMHSADNFLPAGNFTLVSSVTAEQAGLCSHCPWQHCSCQLVGGACCCTGRVSGCDWHGSWLFTDWQLQDNPASALCSV